MKPDICVTLHPSSLRSTVSTPHSLGWNMNVRRKEENRFAVRSRMLAIAACKTWSRALYESVWNAIFYEFIILGDKHENDYWSRSEFVPGIVKDSIEKKARVLWLQDGVIHHEGAEMALSAGLQVVMDRCIFRDHKRLIQGVPLGRILADFRIEQGVSLDDVAKSIDMTTEALKIIEDDPDGDISTDLLKRIASVIEGR